MAAKKNVAPGDLGQYPSIHPLSITSGVLDPIPASSGRRWGKSWTSGTTLPMSKLVHHYTIIVLHRSALHLVFYSIIYSIRFGTGLKKNSRTESRAAAKEISVDGAVAAVLSLADFHNTSRAKNVELLLTSSWTQFSQTQQCSVAKCSVRKVIIGYHKGR